MNRQRTLFGGFAPQKTYFNRSPRTLYEQFVEAYYFFNKSKMGKEDITNAANKLWKENKGNEQYTNTLIKKHKAEKLKLSERCASKTEGFFEKKTVVASSINMRSSKSTVVSTSKPVVSKPISSAVVANSSIT